MTPAYEDLRAIAELATDLLATAAPDALDVYRDDIADALEGLGAVEDHLHLANTRPRKAAA